MVELDAEDSCKLTGPANEVLLLQHLRAAAHTTHIVVHHFPSTITYRFSVGFHLNLANITLDLFIGFGIVKMHNMGKKDGIR